MATRKLGHGRIGGLPVAGLGPDVAAGSQRLVLQGPGNLRLPRDELKHAFVLLPLVDIAPEAVEPRSGRTLAALWREHPDHATPPQAVPFP